MMLFLDHFAGFVATPPGAIMVAALVLVIGAACYDLAVRS